MVAIREHFSLEAAGNAAPQLAPEPKGKELARGFVYTRVSPACLIHHKNMHSWLSIASFNALHDLSR